MTYILANLEFVWLIVVLALLTGYAMLDGFDLGVGMLHLFSKSDLERRLMLNSIGPVWDGNEVWLVTAGGALFAGFPIVYATLCSALYMPLMLLLSGIIFRAVAIEVRSKQTMSWWRWFWDVQFSIASLVISVLLGITMGNLIRGLPLDPHHEFIGSIHDILHPYNLLIGILTVALFTMHGAIYLLMKTEKELQDKVRLWINPAMIFFIMSYTIATAATLIYMPHMTEAVRERPIFFFIAVLNMLAIANIPREITLKREYRAFASSCFNIVCLMVLFGLGIYPNIVRDINAPETLSLTLMNSASSSKTLSILLLMAVIGIPLVVSYTYCVYWIFRGKVKLDPSSY